MLAPASPGAGLLQICTESGWNRQLDAGASTAGGQPTKVRGLSVRGSATGRGTVGGGCARQRDGAVGGGRTRSRDGPVGRGVKPSTAGNTGYGANCAARTLMNPFTPTFPRYGAVIEINCYVTNN